jgi:hypothetical protein
VRRWTRAPVLSERAIAWVVSTRLHASPRFSCLFVHAAVHGARVSSLCRHTAMGTRLELRRRTCEPGPGGSRAERKEKEMNRLTCPLPPALAAVTAWTWPKGMRTKHGSVCAVAGLCLVGTLLVVDLRPIALVAPPQAIASLVSRTAPAAHHNRHRVRLTPFEVAVREINLSYHHASNQVEQERERVEAWDPQAAGGGNLSKREHWHQQQLALDTHGELHKALAAAEKASSLARSAPEKRLATIWMVELTHNCGDHGAEVKLARQWVDRNPGDEAFTQAWQRAVRCNQPIPQSH